MSESQPSHLKILLISEFPFGEKPLIPSRLSNQMEIYTYFIDHYLRMKDVAVLWYRCPPGGKKNQSRYDDLDTTEIPAADHAILIDQRGFTKRPGIFFDVIKSKVSGAVCTIAANNAVVGPEDILFYLIPEGKRNKHHCKLVNWACSENLCKPSQDPNTIRILVDHSYYGHNGITKTDQTRNILDSLCRYTREHNTMYPGRKIIIRHFVSGGIVTVDPDNPENQQQYDHRGVPYLEACKEYSKTDIYVVTHQECMGLTVLETAMAGALVVSTSVQRNGMTPMIKGALLQSLHHFKYDVSREIPWRDIIKNIDHDKARQKALRFTWNNTVGTMLTSMKYWTPQKIVHANRHPR